MHDSPRLAARVLIVDGSNVVGVTEAEGAVERSTVLPTYVEIKLAAGDVEDARAVAWHAIEALYEAARVRPQMARACSQLGDHDTAEMELDAARRVFEQLDSAPALEQVRELMGRATSPATGGLTPREVEALRLVATGATHREIADSLVMSDKTVARHVSNLFTKLGLSRRAAATAYAYAYEHDIV